MTIRARTTGPQVTLQFETAQVGGTTPRVWAQRAMTPLARRYPSTTPSVRRGSSALYGSRPGVPIPRVQQHGEEVGANQRRHDVGSGGLRQHRNLRNPAGLPKPIAGRDHRHHRAVNIGVDQACVDQRWVGRIREPETNGGANIRLLTDPLEVP